MEKEHQLTMHSRNLWGPRVFHRAKHFLTGLHRLAKSKCH